MFQIVELYNTPNYSHIVIFNFKIVVKLPQSFIIIFVYKHPLALDEVRVGLL